MILLILMAGQLNLNSPSQITITQTVELVKKKVFRPYQVRKFYLFFLIQGKKKAKVKFG